MGANGQPILRVHEAGTAEHWKSQIAEAATPLVPMPPIQVPVRADIEFIFPRPKSHYRSNGALKPSAPYWYDHLRDDRDNLDKAVLDCLTVIGMWRDDGLVCAGEIIRRYAQPNERSGAVVAIHELGDPSSVDELPICEGSKAPC